MTWDEFSFFKAAPVQSDYTENIELLLNNTFGHLLFIILNKTQIGHQHKTYKDC